MIGKRFLLIVGGALGGLGAVVSITPPQFGSAGGLTLGGNSLVDRNAPVGSPSSSGLVTSPTTSASTPTNTPAKSSAAPTKSSGAPAKSSTTRAKSSAAPTKSSAAPVTSSPSPVAKPSSTTPATASADTPASTPVTTPTATPTTPAAKATTSAPTPVNTPTPVTPTKKAGVTGTFTGAAAQTFYGPVQVQITVNNGKIVDATALVYPTESFRDQQINKQAIPYLIQETLAAQSANIQGVGGASYTSQGWYESLGSALAKAGI